MDQVIGRRTVSSTFVVFALVFSVTFGLTPTAKALEVCTSFEGADQFGTFTEGISPISAEFAGGVSERRGIGALYHSGLKAWHVDDMGSVGTVTFETPATNVDFYHRYGTPSPNSVVRVFDTNQQEIFNGTGSTAFWTRVNITRTPPQTLIGSVTYTNVGAGTAVFDDFCFTAQTEPFAVAGSDQTVIDTDDDGSEDVTLDGSGSADANGNIVTYQWLENAQEIAVGVSPVVNLGVGEHTITLRVTDNNGETGEDDIVVTVLEKKITGIVGLSDVNGNSSPDFGVLLFDTATATNKVYVKDINTGDSITTIDYGSGEAVAVAVAPDVNGNGVEEIVVLTVVSPTSIQAQVRDGADGTLIRTVSFAPAFAPVAMGIIPDIDGGTTVAIAVLGVNGAGDVRAQVKNAFTGALINTVQFAPAFAPQFMTVVPDASGNGISELAVLGIDGAGNIRVQLKDAATGVLQHFIQYARAFDPVAMVTVPNADGTGRAAVAVLQVHPVDGRVRVQSKFADTRARVGTGFVNFSPTFEFRDFIALPDVSGNNISEIAYLGVDAGGLVRAQIKDSVTRTLLRQVFFAQTFPPDGFVVTGDVNGNSVPELGVFGTNQNNGNTRAQFKDTLSAAEVNAIFVP